MAAPLHLQLASLDDDDPWIIEQKYFTILDDCLQPGSQLSAAEAAARINQLTPMNRETSGEEVEEATSFLLEFWSTIGELARQIPHDHPSQDKMIEILKELQALPVVEVPDGEWGLLRIWTELPYLTENWTEFNFKPKPEDKSTEFERWINRQAFAARLLQAGLADLFRLPTWCFKDALEHEPSEMKEYFECQIRAAVQWIEHSRDILFRSLDNLPNFSALLPGPLYTGKVDLSRERWDFWESRLRELATGGMLTEATALVCHKAAQQMAEMAVTNVGQEEKPVIEEATTTDIPNELAGKVEKPVTEEAATIETPDELAEQERKTGEIEG